MRVPWDDCKVAFGVTDPDAIDRAALPPGWEYCETDGTGARYVAVFRVTGLPTIADGQRVRAALRKAGAL